MTLDFPARDMQPLPRPVRQSWPHDHIEPYSTPSGPLGSTPMSDYGHFSASHGPITGPVSLGPIGPPPRAVSVSGDWEMPVHFSPDFVPRVSDSSTPMDTFEPLVEMPKRRATESLASGKHHSQRRSSNRDEFDGPHQLLERPPPQSIGTHEWDLPTLPTNLDEQEQDQILCEVNDRLSRCAFDFVAKYQFPIPVEQDKRQVKVPADREWTEWVFLLKRLATKRRIPARVLYNGQIKQFVTVLENSLEMRHAAKHQSRPVKDDRNVLQLISAGTQVAKILKDAPAMEYLDRLYVRTERQIHERQRTRPKFSIK
ncbi:hypothetical protein FQN54_003787 [Arachnomyces sp. PD_36]|nr:hypothetical protein FQN54_003787 [Arachnomyces sp. PD_36]